MKKITLIGALLAMLIPTALHGQRAFALELEPVEVIQESPDSATYEARWYYTPNQNWTVAYDYEVASTTGDIMFSGQTPDQTFSFVLPRADVDAQYSFRVRVARLAPSARNGPWSGDTFTVPARAVEAVYANATPTTAPYVVPHEPAFAMDKGTVWLEFTPDRLTDRQGLFCKDASGYGTGGHFCVTLDNGQIEVRIQDDTASYTLLGGVIVDSTLNQLAVVFGDNGIRLYTNTVLVASDPYNGGIAGNVESIRIGAGAQGAQSGTDEWDNPLVGTIENVEFYNGVYDFSQRWGDVPIPPPGPVDSVTVIRVANMRVWRDANDLSKVAIQYQLPPAGYRYVDYRLDPPQKESLSYEVWVDGQRAGYTVDASGGVMDCSLMPGGECENGEVIPVRPFRSG